MFRIKFAIVLACVCIPAITANGQIFRRGQHSQSQPQNQQPAFQQPSVNPNQRYVQPVPQVVLPAQSANQPRQNQRTQPMQQPKLHWSQTLTNNREHNFGAVAKASTQEFIFSFTNPLESDLYLTGVRTSCGCTKPTILTSVVKPGEMAKVLAKYDTVNFDGQRGATVSVSLQRQSPYFESAEIQFSVKGMIRRDVVLDPGGVDFGNVMLGNPKTQKIAVKYAGNPNWQITEALSTNSNITAQFTEKRRDVQMRRVDYELTVTVDANQPNGPLNDQVTLVTNDSTNQKITVSLAGMVKQPIQASPVQLGIIVTGGMVAKTLLVKGEQPFEIKEIKHGTSRLRFQTPTGSKPLHIVQYEFDSSVNGNLQDSITIVTDNPNQPELTITFAAQVVPGTFVQDKK
jgi:hypothetical protein